MNLPFQHKLSSSSLRLAVSYLAIIMVLSVSFSVIFYRTSTSNLHLSLTTTGSPQVTAQAPITIMNGSDNPSPDFVGSTIYSLNDELQKRINELRANLLRRLIFLNIGAVAVGAVFSYYLARRTLRPIEDAMAAQARFASDASHELRTPLTVMLAEIEVVLNKSNLTLDRAKAALKSNYQEVTKLKELSEGLLRLARPPVDDQFGPVALDEVVSEAVNQCLKLAQAKQVTIADSVPSLVAQGDRQSLEQVLIILLDNAIKYSPHGKTITIEGETEGKQVLLRVRDEGPGIRATDLPHIFERFYRADPSRSKQRVSGYGLGLAIARGIIMRHHGTISVASDLGHGAVFTISLPQ